MTRSLLTALVTIGLLASGDVCSWLCQAATSQSASQTEVESHCAGGPGPPVESPAGRGHEDCSACTLEVAAASTPLVAAATDLVVAFASPHAPCEAGAPSAGPCQGPTRADRSPPHDVLAITSILIL